MNIINNIATEQRYLLQLALMLSIVRLDLNLLDTTRNPLIRQEISVSFDSNYNYSGFHESINFQHFDGFMPSKVPHERDIFYELNNLGSFGRHSTYRRDIYAYAVNDENENSVQALQQIAANQAVPEPAESENGTSSNEIVTFSDAETESETPSELSLEDAELIDILWKQDVDLGISKEAYDTQSRHEEYKKELEYENLKNNSEPTPTGNTNKTNDVFELWKGLNYTVDIETGEYILLPEDDESSKNTPPPKKNPAPDDPELNLFPDGGIVDCFSEFPLVDALAPEENLNESDFERILEEINTSTTQDSTEYSDANTQLSLSNNENAPLDLPRAPLMQTQQTFEDHWQDVANLLNLPNSNNLSSSSFSETAVAPVGNINTMYVTNNTNVTNYQPSANTLNPILIENATLPIAMQPLSPIINNVTTNLTDQSSFVNVVSNSISTLSNNTDPVIDNTQVNFNFDSSLFPFNCTTSQTGHSSNNQTTAILSGLMGDPEFDLIGMTMKEAGLDNINQTEDKVDVSSDSALSSMSSERLPSFSDGEWFDSSSETSQQDHGEKFFRTNDSIASGVYPRFNASVGSNNMTTSDHKYYMLSNGDRINLAQKKYKFFGKRMQQENHNIHPNNAGNEENRDANLTQYGGPNRNQGYENYGFEPREDDPQGAMAMAPPPTINKSLNMFVNQHNHSSQNETSDFIHHNHTYSIRPDDVTILNGSTHEKIAKKHTERDKSLTRDEKRAKELNIPISIDDIVGLSMDEFNEKISRYDFSDTQLTLIRDVRRRGKNKVAAQNCRKRKLDQIFTLEDELQQLKSQKAQLQETKENLKCEKELSYFNYLQLHDKVFKSLLVRQQQQLTVDHRFLNPEDYSLQITPEGNVYLAPKNPTNIPADFFNRIKFRSQDRK